MKEMKETEKSIKISDFTKEEIEKYKNWLPEYLELKGINPNKLMRCFSKKHEDKHPSMSLYKKANICKCFACGEKIDIFNLMEIEYDIKSYPEQIAKVKELYEDRSLIKNANETIYAKKNTEVALDVVDKNKGIKITKKEDKEYPELFYYFRDCKNNLKNNEVNYLEKRGIIKEVIDKYNIGFDANFKPYYNMKKSIQAIIISVSPTSYTARNIDTTNNYFRYSKVGTNDIFNYHELFTRNKVETFFIVEGEIDALSLCSVGEKAIAIRSISNYKNLLDYLRKIIQIIIL